MAIHLSHMTCCLIVSCLMVSWPASHGGKVLIVPIEGSHWVNMNVFIRALHSRGHQVTVVRNDKSWYIKEVSPHYSSITVSVTDTPTDLFKSLVEKIIDIERGKTSAYDSLIAMLSATKIHEAVCEMVTSMFKDEALMTTLRESRYDLVLTDPGWAGGVLLARYLQLPLVYNVRWVTNGEGHSAIAPSPLSYIPMTKSGHSDRMTFTERVKNVLVYLFVQTYHRFLTRPHYQAVCDEFLEGVDYYELLQGADLWLMRVDFVFEFPRPTMPNVIYIGGFQCKPAKPLPQDLEEFVQSAGEHGVVIMSLGTFVDALSSDIADEIASAFAQLPQKVIWKHKGRRPATLGNNTLLVDWMPQEDLLGHLQIKAFVAHGGTNGLQEAVYHGVPVVGLPLFFDQYDNLFRLKEKGAAKILSLPTVDKDNNFLQALEEVLNDPSYRTNMQRLSRLHRDQPVKPLDLAMFWIEFVMRHKGAAHLRTESYRMPWYVYHSVDVVAFLLTITLFSMLIFAALIRCCFKVCFRGKVKHGGGCCSGG